jgi:YgiT-type zinc finger domain-containing protein
MFKCEVCGSTEARQEAVDEVFHVGSRYVLVEHIPAMVCAKCGEKTFSRAAVESMRLKLNGASQPARSLEMDVFAF